MTPPQGAEAVAAALSEANLQRHVVALARQLDYLVYHAHDSRHSAAGFPDLIAIRGAEMFVIECKREKGKLTADQWEWLNAFTNMGSYAFVLRPRHWFAGKVDVWLGAGIGPEVNEDWEPQ